MYPCAGPDAGMSNILLEGKSQHLGPTLLTWNILYCIKILRCKSRGLGLVGGRSYLQAKARHNGHVHLAHLPFGLVFHAAGLDAREALSLLASRVHWRVSLFRLGV